MKPTYTYDETLLDNAAEFTDEFYKRFTLRHAPIPLSLDDKITKDYLFPTFYGDVTCAMGIFLCSYEKAQKIMPHPLIKPVKMTKGRSMVAFSCYEYKNVMGVAPYNEIAMTIPVMVNPKVNVPILPTLLSSFKNFGYYVFSMPVTSLENKIRGNKIWGLPKVVREIDLYEEKGDCVTTCREDSGEKYFELRVPIEGKKTPFDETTYLYSVLEKDLLKSKTNFKADFNVTKHMNLLFKKDVKPDKAYITIGNTPSGKALLDLDIEEHPFQLRFAKHMTSCFDLRNPEYKSSISF